MSMPEEKGGFNNFIVVEVKDSVAVNVTAKDINGVTKGCF